MRNHGSAQTFVVHYLADQMKKQYRVFLLGHGYYSASARANTSGPKNINVIRHSSFGLSYTHVILPDCFRDDGRAQVNSNVMIALRTSPPALSTIECNVLGERRKLANVVTRFTAEVSSIDAIALNLCAPVGPIRNNAKSQRRTDLISEK